MFPSTRGQESCHLTAMPNIWQQQLTLTRAILFCLFFPSPSVCHCTWPDITHLLSAGCAGSKILLCLTLYYATWFREWGKARLPVKKWKCMMWDRWQWKPRLCLRDEFSDVQSPQTLQIVSEVPLMRCSPINSLDFKGQKTPPKRVPLHLFKVMSIKDQNYPNLPTCHVTEVILR